MPNRPHTRAPSRVWLFPAAPRVHMKFCMGWPGRVGVELKELVKGWREIRKAMSGEVGVMG